MTAVESGPTTGDPGAAAGRGSRVAGAAPGERPDVDFPVLDALRAVGALAVLTTHVAFWSGHYTVGGFWGILLARLDIGVALFFVLSGFLLSRSWFDRAADGRPGPRTGRYVWKRWLRIAPLYLVTAVLALSFIDANAARGPVDWLRTLLLLDPFVDGPLPEGLTHMWSLSVEVTFYLALPLLMWLITGGRALRVARAGLVLLGLVACSVWWHLAGAAAVDGVTEGAPLLWLPAYLSWFAIGMTFALAHELWVRDRAVRLLAPVVSLARQPGSCWALAASALLVAATPLAGSVLLVAPTPAQSLAKSGLYALVGGLVVITGVFADPDGTYARTMSAPAARHLGWISYGIFALHLPLIHLLMYLTGWQIFEAPLVPLWLLTVATSLLVAEVAYRVVERPALRLKAVSPPWPWRRRPSTP